MTSLLLSFYPYLLVLLLSVFLLFFCVSPFSGSIDMITWGLFQSPNYNLGNAFKHLQRAFVFIVLYPGPGIFAVNHKIHNAIVVSLKSENGKKVAKLAKDSDIRRTALNTILQKLDKFKFAFLSSEHMRKYDRISYNNDQKTLLNSRNQIDWKHHLKEGFVAVRLWRQFAYSDAFLKWRDRILHCNEKANFVFICSLNILCVAMIAKAIVSFASLMSCRWQMWPYSLPDLLEKTDIWNE